MWNQATCKFKRCYFKERDFYEDGKIVKHKILYIEFKDFSEPVPCEVYRVKDTFALYEDYVKEFTNAKEGDQCLVKFGSERGRHGGRIVSARRLS